MFGSIKIKKKLFLVKRKLMTNRIFYFFFVTNFQKTTQSHIKWNKRVKIHTFKLIFKISTIHKKIKVFFTKKKFHHCQKKNVNFETDKVLVKNMVWYCQSKWVGWFDGPDWSSHWPYHSHQDLRIEIYTFHKKEIHL